MAAIRFTQVRNEVGGCIRYIADAEKIMSPDEHNIFYVYGSIDGAEGVSRVYSYSKRCSSNPTLAAHQIALHRSIYFESKMGNAGIQGLAKGKPDLRGLHIFVSYTTQDDPSEKTMNEIISLIAELPQLRDFALFWAHHFNREHKHTHLFISAYSAEGIPRKLCFKKADYDDIRKNINHLCVERNLSIINLAKLRHNDPAYSQWIDGVIAEGKVVVHPERKEHKLYPKQRISTQHLYYKWQHEQNEKAKAKERLLSDSQRKKEHFESKYYYTTNNDKGKRWYASGDPQHRFYTVSRKTPDGYSRSEIELSVRFVMFVAGKEGEYIKKGDPVLWLKYNAKIDAQLQGIIDCISTAKRLRIENYTQIPNMIADVQRQMNALRQTAAIYERNIAEKEEIIAAYRIYTRAHQSIDGRTDQVLETTHEIISAYNILLNNQVLTSEAYASLCKCYEFEMKKLEDYRKRIPELAKIYHDLKKLEEFTAYRTGILQEIFDYSSMVQNKFKPCSKKEKTDNFVIEK